MSRCRTCRGGRSIGSRPRNVALALSLAASLTGLGCGIREEFHQPRIANLRSDTIEVHIDSRGVSTSLATVAAGSTVGLSVYEDKCTGGTMVARTSDGQEIARRTAPLCPEETWTIGREP